MYLTDVGLMRLKLFFTNFHAVALLVRCSLGSQEGSILYCPAETANKVIRLAYKFCYVVFLRYVTQSVGLIFVYSVGLHFLSHFDFGYLEKKKLEWQPNLA